MLLLLACAPKAPPEPAAPTTPPGPAAPTTPALRPTRLTAPGPLAERPWNVPAAATGKLSNGIPVYVVENHEVPLVNVRLSLGIGTTTDPVGKEGVADAAMTMLAHGAGKYTTETYARALKALGSNFNAYAASDDASVVISTLSRNLEATLDLAATAVFEPTFPKDEWKLLQKQYLDDIEQRRKDPVSKGATVLTVVTHGAAYRGRITTDESIRSIGLNDLQAWKLRWFEANKAAIYVGGDTTLAQVLPLLEARFAKLTRKQGATRPVSAPPPPSGRPLALVDEPGAAQSILSATRYAGHPTDADYAAFYVANEVWGGQFTSRLNMNLREDKGYTYGARSSVTFDLAGTQWFVRAPVQADKTLPALEEIRKEIDAAVSSRPFTEEEIANARGALIASYPLGFESPGELLGLLRDVRLYALGDGWIATWLDKVRAVTAASANAAWKARANGEGLRWVVVGDATTLQAPLAGLGFQVELRDADGVLVK